jgi:rhodanese-related sulfurtransferase
MDKELDKIKKHQNQAFERMAQVLNVLSAPVRIKLIHFLSQAPLSVEVLADKVGQSTANTSMHLRKMHNEGILQVESIGQKRLYSLHSALFEFWEECQDFVKKIDPDIFHTADDDTLTWTKDLKESLKLARENQITILDLRPLDEVREDWFPVKTNYLHIPFASLKKNLKKIPKKKKVVVLCRGRLCGLSQFAVRYLREQNFDAYRLPESWFKLSKEVNVVSGERL